MHRFADPSRPVSVGRTDPQHRESDTIVHRGHITKQGSKLVRWRPWKPSNASRPGTKISIDRKRIEARRGKNIAKIARPASYYGLRDGHIRALAHQRAAA